MKPENDVLERLGKNPEIKSRYEEEEEENEEEEAAAEEGEEEEKEEGSVGVKNKCFSWWKYVVYVFWREFQTVRDGQVVKLECVRFELERKKMRQTTRKRRRENGDEMEKMMVRMRYEPIVREE
ncbi:hypothetical protein RUM43_004705 [Polyplax serrata]|uniref:Uncharacterized protein n=1 Tax=Polyplax serrata TaxID=468196 RepID=A0AAN8SDN6_POLSC